MMILWTNDPLIKKKLLARARLVGLVRESPGGEGVSVRSDVEVDEPAPG